MKGGVIGLPEASSESDLSDKVEAKDPLVLLDGELDGLERVEVRLLLAVGLGDRDFEEDRSMR